MVTEPIDGIVIIFGPKIKLFVTLPPSIVSPDVLTSATPIPKFFNVITAPEFPDASGSKVSIY